MVDCGNFIFFFVKKKKNVCALEGRHWKKKYIICRLCVERVGKDEYDWKNNNNKYNNNNNNNNNINNKGKTRSECVFDGI